MADDFLNKTPIVQKTKAITDECDSINFKALHRERDNYQNQETAYRMGECLWQLFIG
jgi:hypothetical protein